MSTAHSEVFAEIGIPANPFPGLRPFEPDESHLFFGRDGQTEQLISKLSRARFVAVVGTSGSGKSSLVRAGMLPALLGAHSGWRIVVLRPGNDPIGNLARALNAPAEFGPESEGSVAVQTAITESTLRRGSRGLVEAGRHLGLSTNENLLVVVDQFEEIFRFSRVAEGEEYQNNAAAFVKLLLEAAGQREVPIYVTLTMRSDYLGDCSRFWGLPEAVNESQYLIPRLTRDQLREAIAGPIAVGHGSIAPRLLNRLLNDVGDNQDQLPILQHGLMRTWERWTQDHQENEPMDLRHYEAIGGMAEALSQHVDEAFNELPDDDSRETAEKVFKALTEKGPDNREIRRPITLGELSAVTGATQAQAVRVIETFRQPGRSFLMPPAYVTLNGESLIDISHESLIRCCARLRTWVEQEANSARIYRRLAETAQLHQEGKAGLWGDPDLQLALDWREKSKPNEHWARRYHPGFDAAMAFLEQSREQRDREILEKQKQQRRIRRMTMALFALSIVASVVFGYLLYHARQVDKAAHSIEKEAERTVAQAKDYAEKTTDRANTLAAEANKAEDKAIVEQAAAERAQDDAKTAQQRLLAMNLAAGATTQFQRGNLALSSVLAVESLKASDTPQGQSALAEALRITPPTPEIITTKGSKLSTLAFSTDGRWMAWGETDRGRVVLSDLSHRREDMVLGTTRPPVFALAFSDDGKLLAAGTFGALWLWDTATGKPVQDPISTQGAYTRSVAFSPNGQFLAIVKGHELGLLQKTSNHWDELKVPAMPDPNSINGVIFLKTGDLAIATTHDIVFMSIPSLSLSNDNKSDFACAAIALSENPGSMLAGWLAAACSHEIFVTDLMEDPGHNHARTIPTGNLTFNQISVSRDGVYIAARNYSSDEIHVYDMVTGQESFRINFPSANLPTASFAFRPEGEVLSAASRDGSIATWQLRKGGLSLRRDCDANVTALTFSPDKKWLAISSADDTVRIIRTSDIETFKPVQTFKIGPGLQKPLFSPDGRFLAVLDLTGVHLIQTSPWKRLALHDVTGEFLEAAFSPDSRMLVTLDAGGIRRFDTATWQEKKPSMSGLFERGLRFSPDGKWLRTDRNITPIGSHGRTLLFQVWRLATGTEVAWKEYGRQSDQDRPPQGGPQKLMGDSEAWLNGKQDQSGSPPFVEVDGGINDSAVSPDGRWLLTASGDKTVRLWPLRVDDLIDRACKLLSRNLTPDEWKAQGLAGPYHKSCPNLP